MDDPTAKSNEDKSEDEGSVASTSTTRSLRVKTSRSSQSSNSPAVTDKTEKAKAKPGDKNSSKLGLPDMMIEWCDVDVTFRVTRNKRINSEKVYPMFPTSKDLSKIPSLANLTHKSIAAPPAPKAATLAGFLGVDKSPEKSPSKTPATAKNAKQAAASADGKNKCHICDRVFTKSSYLRSHLQSHPNSKPFKCEICNWGFYQQDNLIRHMASHPQGGDGFKCTHCAASFNTKSVLLIHMRDAHGEKAGGSAPATPAKPATVASESLSPVKMTSKTSPSKTTTPTPIKTPLGPPPPLVPIRPPLKVTLSSPFVTKSPGTATSPFSNSPQLPLKKLPTAAEVLSGMKTSPLTGGARVLPLLAGKRPVQVGSGLSPSSSQECRCHVCGKLFLTASNLAQHMNYHVTKSKPFKCNFCDARFAQESNLEKHVAIAHGAIGHPCPHCSITFRTPRDMESHVELMHPASNGMVIPVDVNDVYLDDEMPDEAYPQFRCSVCYKAFDKIQLLNQHSKEHHKLNQDVKPIVFPRASVSLKREEF